MAKPLDGEVPGPRYSPDCRWPWQPAHRSSSRAPERPTHPFDPPQGRIERLRVDSAALAANLLGDPSTRTVDVYLPPGYDASDESYPLKAWMVMAGMTGPATLACAETVAEDLAGAIPTLQNGQGRVRWDVVKCTVQRHGDQEEVTSHRIVDGGWFSDDDGSNA